MEIFPTLTSAIEQDDFNESLENPALAKEMEGGYTVTRPRHTRTTARESFTIHYPNMSNADKTTLKAFWNLVKGSSAMFQWNNPASGETRIVRFKPGSTLDFKYAYYHRNTDGTSDHRWNVSIELEDV